MNEKSIVSNLQSPNGIHQSSFITLVTQKLIKTQKLTLKIHLSYYVKCKNIDQKNKQINQSKINLKFKNRSNKII